MKKSMIKVLKSKWQYFLGMAVIVLFVNIGVGMNVKTLLLGIGVGSIVMFVSFLFVEEFDRRRNGS